MIAMMIVGTQETHGTRVIQEVATKNARIMTDVVVGDPDTTVARRRFPGILLFPVKKWDIRICPFLTLQPTVAEATCHLMRTSDGRLSERELNGSWTQLVDIATN